MKFYVHSIFLALCFTVNCNAKPEKKLFEDISQNESLQSVTTKHPSIRCPHISKQGASFSCTIVDEPFFDIPVTKKIIFVENKAVAIIISVREYSIENFYANILSNILQSPGWTMTDVASPLLSRRIDVISMLYQEQENWMKEVSDFSAEAVAMGMLVFMFSDASLEDESLNSEEFLKNAPQDTRVLTINLNTKRQKIDISIQMPNAQFLHPIPEIKQTAKGKVF